MFLFFMKKKKFLLINHISEIYRYLSIEYNIHELFPRKLSVIWPRMQPDIILHINEAPSMFLRPRFNPFMSIGKYTMKFIWEFQINFWMDINFSHWQRPNNSWTKNENILR